MFIKDVYLEKEHFNETCNAAIPGAWVAYMSDGTHQAFAREFDFISESDAWDYALEAFEEYN